MLNTSSEVNASGGDGNNVQANGQAGNEAPITGKPRRQTKNMRGGSI